MPMPGAPTGPELLWLVPMWIVMMVAMMIPSAAPMILLFAGVARQRQLRHVPTASAAVFTLGYLLVWAFYATIAAVAQWQLHRLALLTPAMAAASPLLGGGLLVLAGIYQCAAGQGSVPLSLPLSPGVLRRSMAGGQLGCPPDGTRTWDLLRRLLLGLDVAAFRCRRHEPPLGHGYRSVRANRKTPPPRSTDRSGGWPAADRLGTLVNDRLDSRLILPRQNHISVAHRDRFSKGAGP